MFRLKLSLESRINRFFGVKETQTGFSSVRFGWSGDFGRIRMMDQDLSGTIDIARSANAVIVREGFTPGFADTADPSMTYRPS